MHSKSLDSYSPFGNTIPSADAIKSPKKILFHQNKSNIIIVIIIKIKEFIVFQMDFQITFCLTFNLIVSKTFGLKKIFF